MNSPVTSLKGVGAKTADLLKRLSIYSVSDLVSNFPRSYENYSEPVPICECPSSGLVTVSGIIYGKPYRAGKGSRSVVSVWCDDGTAKIKLTWFNNPWITNSLAYGKRLVFRGHVYSSGKSKSITQPMVFDYDEYSKLAGSLLPVYSLTSGITNKTMRKLARMALDMRESDAEFLPSKTIESFSLRSHDDAVGSMHFPLDIEDLRSARKRIVFEEFFMFLMALRMLREGTGEKKTNVVFSSAEDCRKLISTLPYDLTNAQKKAWKEISENLASGLVMNRLLQGDVGSGKTVVAALAMLQATEAGYQAAMIAPTQILAEQHYQNLCRMYNEAGIERNVVLLTGSMTAKQKREAKELIENGTAHIVIGTHAVITDTVVFSKLGLVITDEQHRFGVRQRETFSGKGEGGDPHVLVMSATPIPRTLAIILYGDLSVSILDEKPANRLPIKNCVVGTDFRERSFDFIQKEVAKGHQCYVICPMVEDNDEIDAVSAITEAKELKKKFGKDIKVDLLHGRMKGSEKEKVMSTFASGTTDVLVSTTVVEVGVDVPNATVMMVENAERFGLAQLHQLRGRIGRGSEQSYCIFIDGADTEGGNERLNVLLNSNDGFNIASEDLKLRGPGDLFGIRQSGELMFATGDIYGDADILKCASDEADRIRELDPQLKKEEHSALSVKLDKYLAENSEKLFL